MGSFKTHKTRLAMLLLAVLQLMNINQVHAVEEININDQGVMLHGYDTVSYFQANGPKKGFPDYQANYQGGTYYFSSQQNRDKFIAHAADYIPAYGGYCSYGVRMGQKLSIDPLSWKIVNGILYLQLNPGTRTLWDKDLKQNIAIADRVWLEIRSKPVPK